MPNDFEPSGLSDLIDVFRPADAAPAEAAPAASPESTPAPAAPTPEATPAQPPAQPPAPAEDPAGLIADERVQRQIAAQVQAELARRQDAANTAQMLAYLNTLPDQEYGRLRREQDQAQSAYQATANQVAAHLYNQWWGDLTSFLDKEGVAEKDRPDPQQFQSFEALQAAVADTIADRRAEKKAEALAKVKAEAMVQERLAKVYQDYGESARQPIIQSAGAAEELPESASGMDFLRAHYREMDRKR